jgi:betaine-aldehyde dehydrogenase
VDRAYQAAAQAFTAWKETTPSERQRALLKIADALEAHADELVAIESENTGKPIPVTASEEIPPMLDQIRFFAGAAAVLEGRAAGEYLRRVARPSSAASRSGSSARSLPGTTR